jgi:hypothetical protein
MFAETLTSRQINEPLAADQLSAGSAADVRTPGSSRHRGLRLAATERRLDQCRG